MRKKFKLSHSLLGLVALVVVQGIGVAVLPGLAMVWLTLVIAAAGAILMLYVSTEVIDEVRNVRHMLTLLLVVVSEFVLFFAFEYYFLGILSPSAFPTLPHDAVSLLLHSMMIFVFNPLYLPGNGVGRILLLINTAAALGLVMFILQNIWQFRRDAH
jgi:hypothetical protein